MPTESFLLGSIARTTIGSGGMAFTPTRFRHGGPDEYT